MQANRLDLSWITVGGEPVAAQYNLLGKNRIYFYQCGRKIEVPKQIRLGIFMNISMIKRGIALGYKEYDFLAGESGYKALFATGVRPLSRVRVSRRTAREGVLQALKGVRTVARRLGVNGGSS